MGENQGIENPPSQLMENSIIFFLESIPYELFLVVLGALALAKQKSSELKYSTVELLKSGASFPILLIKFSDIWGIVGCRHG